MSHPGNAIGYHGIVDKRHCRNNWCLSVPRSNVDPKQQQTKLKECVTMQSLPPAMHARSGKSRLIWYGRCKEPWIKGAAGTGSVDQQAVERHW